eukprot:s3498_g2.t1
MVIFIITTISISITLLLIIVLVICPCNSADLVVIRIVATATQLRAKKCSGQQLDLWFDRSHQQFQQTVTQMLEEDQEAMLRKSESLQPRRKQPEEGWRLSVVPAPSAPRAEAKGRTKSTTLSGSPSLLPHMTDAFDEDLDQVTPKQTRRSKTRAATSASSMREGALEKDIGCRILIGMPCLAYVLTAFFTLLGIIPLIGLHVRGGVFSAPSRHRLMGWALPIGPIAERWKYAISWLVLNFCFLATWSVDVWICFTTCMDPTPGAGLEAVNTELGGACREYDMQRWVIFVSAAAVSFLSFAMASGMVLVLAYIHSHLLLGLDRILDCWVADMVETSDFIKGVSSWNSIQALLKSASRELASSFLMLQAFGSLGLMVFLTGTWAPSNVLQTLDAVEQEYKKREQEYKQEYNTREKLHEENADLQKKENLRLVEELSRVKALYAPHAHCWNLD